MVWPFSRGEDNSPDSFERVLSGLASQIRAQTSKLAILRLRSRRYKGLFTLYTVFAWILYVVVILFVVGWKEMGPPEIGGIVGGPVGIWSVRKLLDLYYNNRIGNAESKLDYLQKKQRDTVEKLKAATKFSTTQSIIEKYGGAAASSEADKKKSSPGTPDQQLQQRPPPAPTTPQQVKQQLIQQQLMAQQLSQPRPSNPNPNPVQRSGPPPMLNLPPATTRPSSQQHIQPEEVLSPRWYDRLLDVLVGEDEMSAKNRYALICRNCRMVNGLAPPGTRNLDDMEEWACARCGMMNGRASGPPSRTSSRPSSRMSEELSVPEVEVTRRAKSPTPSGSARITRSKVKKEDEEEGREENSASSEDREEEEEDREKEDEDEDEEETLESSKSKAKAKAKATRGRKRA